MFYDRCMQGSPEECAKPVYLAGERFRKGLVMDKSQPGEVGGGRLFQAAGRARTNDEGRKGHGGLVKGNAVRKYGRFIGCTSGGDEVREVSRPLRAF